MRVPDHIGIIPDGNRRWAESKGLSKEQGYTHGLSPGVKLLRLCKEVGVNEVTYYGFTTDNTERPPKQITAFRQACVDAVEMLANEDASLLVIGDRQADEFPDELESYTEERQPFGNNEIKVNFLVNYGWKWDLNSLSQADEVSRRKLKNQLNSNQVSQVDLVIRWGNRRRLSGFLPVQSVYADFYVVDEYWPDFEPEQFYEALEWYDKQDITYGG
ncbi:polyprenyl diphosphate synthase [Acetohalobium arabaticum]|uniref:Di-trans-poly-cis-decaprenylcistransferase n=1 Tax=Acetohalobium arabaticum (strain ATCC 49924 / DSM 5501 / Z-7288) TaxID=574087 RepID=D9QS55_ACEAZ|nr:polyprenyl diphosphate synthase [Acetohalobium arabaticum]ADL13346.1 Di-trans-poly-cis-decaprenylcistransferase [Acetohalobium arabaticum DSM 5501]